MITVTILLIGGNIVEFVPEEHGRVFRKPQREEVLMPLAPASDPRKGIPNGSFRVVGFDPAQRSWFPVDETRFPYDAYRHADAVNNIREQPGEIAYFVYDDRGMQVRGPYSLAREPRHCMPVAFF